MRSKLFVLLSLILVMAMVGCSVEGSVNQSVTVEKTSSQTAITETTTEESVAASTTVEEPKNSVFPFTFTDGKGQEITLEKKPEKVIPLTGTTMYLYTLTGGQAVAGPSLSENAPRAEGTPDYEDLGHMGNISVEALVMNEPDFVIVQAMQAKIIPVIEENNIPYMYFSGRTLEEIKEQIMLFAKINDNPKRGEQVIAELDSDIEATLAKLPEERNKKIAIVYVAGSGISLKLKNSIAGDVANIIGLNSISNDLSPEKKGRDSTPFDLEMLVEENPEVIFITSMVSADDEVEDVLKAQLEDSSAWSNLDAVQNGKVYFLPQSHFLFNPVDRYDEAVEIMAKYIWPEAFE